MRQVSINKRGREDSTYVTLEDKVLKLSDVKGGVRDGRALHVNHRVRGGGDPESKKPNKQSKMTEKKQKQERQMLVTCQVETKASIYINKYIFIYLFHLDHWVKLDPEQPVQCNSVGMGHVSHCRTSELL